MEKEAEEFGRKEIIGTRGVGGDTEACFSPEGSVDDETIKAMLEYDPWEEIGFVRPLGGFFYNFFFMMITMVLSVFLISIIFRLIFPYPEIQGYNSVATGFFAIVYQLFDVGTAFGIKRFISEYRIKNPQKMLEYIRFYIWYQMFTGIVQVLIISVFVLQYIRRSPLAYLTWVFLIICQKQWPGMLGTYREILGGLQKFNKTQLLNFISGEIFQNLTNIIFILLGRWYGMNNPAVGDLMGGVIGYAIGSYVDDFFSMALAAWYFNKEMKPFGITLRDTFTFKIGKDVVKQCLWFGFQVSIVPVINTATGTLMLIMYYNAIPQYATWRAIYSIAAGIGGVINVGNFELTPALAESYMNGKKNLARFYVSNSIKWNGFLMMFLVVLVASFIPVVLDAVLQLEGLKYYRSVVIFIPWILIHQMFMPYISIPDPILIGTLHIGFYTFMRLSEEALQVLFVYLFVYVFELQSFGAIGMAIILGWEHFFPRLIKMTMGWIYVNRKVFKIKIYWMTTFIIPLIAALPIVVFAVFWNNFVFPILSDYISVLPAAALTIFIGLVVLPFCIFLPLTGILGGWDDFQLKTFRRAVELSGPSKFFTVPFYKAVEVGVKLNPRWHNKFRIPWETAEREIRELQIMKIKNMYTTVEITNPREYFLRLSEERRRRKKKSAGKK